MNDSKVSPYTVTATNTKGIQGGPERTISIEGPTTDNQTFELASRVAPIMLTYLTSLQGVLSNLGGIPSSDDQIILSLSDSAEFSTIIKARFEIINSKEIRFNQHPIHPEIPNPLPMVTEIAAGLSWYRPARFALFNVGTPTLYEYFELHCHTKLWLRMGTSRSSLEAPIPGPPLFAKTLTEILKETHKAVLMERIS